MDLRHSVKYGQLKSAREKNITLYHAISEFIDNSISSWEKNKNSIEKVEIIISFYYDKVNNKKSYVEILDNAGGMNEEELNDGMKNMIFDDLARNNNSKNQYGRGMKDAIFWIGEDSIIYTKKMNEDELIGTYEALNHSNNDDVRNKISFSNENMIKTKSGTLIKILNPFNEKKRRFVDSEIKYLQEFLGFKYYDYIKNNKLSLKLKDVKNNNIYDFDSKKVELFKFNKKDVDDNFYNTLQIWENNNQELLKESLGNNYTIKDLLELLKNNEELILKNVEVKFILDNGIAKGLLDILIFNESNERNSGVYIKHDNRYISLPEPKTNHNIQSLHKYCKSRETCTYHKWFAFDIDLKNIEGNENHKLIYPETNKLNIKFDPNGPIDIEQFNKVFNDLRKILIKFIPLIKDIKEKTQKNYTKQEIERIESNSKELGIEIKVNEDRTRELKENIPFLSDKDILIKYHYKKLSNKLFEFINADYDENNKRCIYEYDFNNDFLLIDKYKDEYQSLFCKIILNFDVAIRCLEKNNEKFDVQKIQELMREILNEKSFKKD